MPVDQNKLKGLLWSLEVTGWYDLADSVHAIADIGENHYMFLEAMFATGRLRTEPELTKYLDAIPKVNNDTAKRLRGLAITGQHEAVDILLGLA